VREELGFNDNIGLSSTFFIVYISGTIVAVLLIVAIAAQLVSTFKKPKTSPESPANRPAQPEVSVPVSPNVATPEPIRIPLSTFNTQPVAKGPAPLPPVRRPIPSHYLGRVRTAPQQVTRIGLHKKMQ
jgi:hypothetical protein